MKQLLKKPLIRYLLYLLAVIPLSLFRDFTLDNELRYLSIADEALGKGSFFTFTNHGILYADKPPLYLWIVMLGKTILGYHSLTFLSIFSFLPALAILYTMDRWVEGHLSARRRLAAELMLLTCAFFIGSAIILRMDMLMCLFIILSLHIFYKMYSGQGKPVYSLLFPLCVFMAIFSKGPLGFIIPLVSITVFLWIKKELKTMGRYWGVKSLSILLGLCALWFTGVYAEGGKQYFTDLLFNQTFNRAINSFHHNEPFYYYFVAIWYSLAPWSLFILGVIAYGMIKKIVSGDLELFFLITALSTLGILSLFSAKLAVYMLPSFPFLVYLSMLWLKKMAYPQWTLPLIALPALIICLALPATFVLQYFDINTPPLVLLAACVLSATGYFTLINLKNHRLNRTIITLGTGLLMSIFIFSFTVPRYNQWIGLGQFCQKAKSIAQRQGVQNYYYCKINRADNLDVYLGVIPQKLRIKDLYHDEQTMKKPAILFLANKYIERSDSIRQYIKGKMTHRTGNYYCIEIE